MPIGAGELKEATQEQTGYSAYELARNTAIHVYILLILSVHIYTNADRNTGTLTNRPRNKADKLDSSYCRPRIRTLHQHYMLGP